MTSNTTIYTGVWTNWSKGVVAGATLTLHVRDGAILIAVLALFIQFAGGQSWSIICFIAHQLRTTSKARSGFYHQQQVTLRNNSSDFGTVWRLSKLAWTWRSHNIKSIRESLALILIGALHLLAFGAAGILSSHFTTLGNEVLLAPSESCGLWFNPAIPTNQSDFAEDSYYEVYVKNSVRSSNEYVQNCLVQSNTLPECNTFKRPRLNWTSTNNAQCPFDAGLCLGLVNNSLYFDTGLIDSRDDLGVNTRDRDRVQYRRTATCNPITTQGYVFSMNVTRAPARTYNSTFTAIAAYYGRNNDLTSEIVTSGLIVNATYVSSNFENFEFLYDVDMASPYKLDAEVAFPTLPNLGFTPIPALYAPNRSITLVFAEFTGVYLGPSDDLWLPAHHITPAVVSTEGNNTSENLFLPDNVFNVLACTEQHQFCNPSLPGNESQQCTPLQSIDQFTYGYGFVRPGTQEPEPLYSNPLQHSLMRIIRSAAYSSSWSYILGSLEPSLLADSLASDKLSLPLPSNQWILEAENWFEVSMANMQSFMVNTATGPPGSDAQYTSGQANSDSGLKQYCESQIIQREDFTSFSVLTIVLIFALGGAVICVSLFLETLVGYLQLRFKRGPYHQVRWQLDSTLQLQRMAFEEVGLGRWRGGADDVPVTEMGEEFAPAAEWDEWHPSIRGKYIAKELSPHSGVGDELLGTISFDKKFQAVC
ncbi:hypothetical protein BDZ45DRAFT_796456 [Acephala macrosclerotiorum]|nr:hypothetical protein BDZ45DRAFT_796456 [Acephala macrosclerotiorum]